ncbi:MAG: hypothetical protein ABIK39_05405 [candidate division WOR-3 bacterium]
MRRGLIFIGIAVCLLRADGFEIRGKVTSAWQKNSFTIETRSEETSLWLEPPQNGRLLAQVATAGAEMNKYRFKFTEPITLKGMKEWQITVLWDSTDGNWRCRLGRGEEPVLKRVQGYADTTFNFTWMLVTEEDVERWRFASPKEATFIVRCSSPGRRGVEEQDLADSPKLEIFGPGVFKIEVEPIDGGGEFVGERIK